MASTQQKPKSKLSRIQFFEGLKIIWNYLRPHKRLIFTLVAVSLVAAATEAFIPLVAGKILDGIVAIAERKTILLSSVFTVIGGWLALRLVSDSIEWRIGFSTEKLSTVLESEYVANGFGRLFEMPLAFHKDRKHGEIGDRIIRASGWLEQLIGRVSINLLPNFLSVIIAIILTAFINYRLMLVLLVAISIYIAILWRSVPYLADLQEKMQRAYSRAYGNTWDALDNIQEIKQAATEIYEQKKIYKNLVQRATPLWLSLAYIWRKISFFQRLLIALTQFSIFALSVFFVKNGSLTPGELFAFNGYAAMIFGPFVILGQNWQTIQNGIVAVVRAEKILSLPTEKYRPPHAVVPKHLEGNVSFENVTFAYKTTGDVLKDVSFRVNAGEKIAFVGRSGVGKTTIIDLLLGFYFPQKGRVVVDGTNIEKFDLTAYRLRIGVVPQEPTLFNDTVEHNISYGNFEKSAADIISAASSAHADEFIGKFPKKYKQLVGWRGIKLSTGQKQRIALARAFLRNPDILILDEPTSALDARSEQLIKESFKKLMQGRTTFIIAHRFSTVREADKILVLEEGRIVEQGNHKELMKIKNGVYQKLYAIQAGLY